MLLFLVTPCLSGCSALHGVNPNQKKVDVAVCRKRLLFRIWKQSQNEEDRKKYYETKKDAMRVVYMVMDQKSWEAVQKVDLCCDGHK